MSDAIPITTGKTQVTDWPTVTVGGRSITLRYSFAAGVQLGKWGTSVARGASLFELCAAMAGNFDQDGKWRSIGYPRALDLADEVLDDEVPVLMEATKTALKKVFPGLTFTSEPGAIDQTTNQKNPETTKTDTSSSGPSGDQAPA